MKPLQIEGMRALADARAIKYVCITIEANNRCNIEVNGELFVANRAGRRRYYAKVDTCINWLRGFLFVAKCDKVDVIFDYSITKR